MGTARRWAIAAAVLLVAIGGLTVTLYFAIPSAEQRRWEGMREWCEKTAREVRARDPRRPVLRGEPVEGNAWDDYQAGFAAIASAKDLRATADLLDKDPKADAAKVRSLVQMHAPALDHIRLGASRSSARRRIDWENAGENMYPRPSDRLLTLAVCRARFLLEDGRAREGMDALVDAGQFAADHALNGAGFEGLHAISLLWYVQNELKGFLDSTALGKEDCRELARALEVMDRNFPREADAEAVGPMTEGFLFLRKESLKEIMAHIGSTRPIKATWRYGFSERLVIVDAFETGVAVSRLTMKAAGKSWKEAIQIEDEINAEFRRPKNPLLRQFAEIQETLSNSPRRNMYRERRAQLRLLRTAAHFRATGELLALDDPYGDKIRASVTETRLKLWSVGCDGVDDGGTGSWDGRKGKDIVLEVDR